MSRTCTDRRHALFTKNLELQMFPWSYQGVRGLVGTSTTRGFVWCTANSDSTTRYDRKTAIGVGEPGQNLLPFLFTFKPMCSIDTINPKCRHHMLTKTTSSYVHSLLTKCGSNLKLRGTLVTGELWSAYVATSQSANRKFFVFTRVDSDGR